MMMMSVFNRYAHIFWIPTFPIGRRGGAQCSQCGQAWAPKDMPHFLKLQYDQMVGQTRIPLWNWIGLAGIVVLVTTISYNVGVHEGNEKLYIANPLKGDVYKFKTETGGYSLMKVIDVTRDSVWVQYNQFETDKMSGVYKLNMKPYEEDTYVLSKGQISDLYESKKIYDVTR
jgi:hypothetical protein